MKRQDIISNIQRNMTDMRRLMFSNFPNIHKNKPTLSQMSVMSVVKETQESTVKDVAKFFKISPPAATQLVNALVLKKLLSRKTDKIDKRKINLKLTESGEKMLTKMKEEQMKIMDYFFKALNDKELKVMASLQKKVVDHMKPGKLI